MGVLQDARAAVAEAKRTLDAKVSTPALRMLIQAAVIAAACWASAGLLCVAAVILALVLSIAALSLLSLGVVLFFVAFTAGAWAFTLSWAAAWAYATISMYGWTRSVLHRSWSSLASRVPATGRRQALAPFTPSKAAPSPAANAASSSYTSHAEQQASPAASHTPAGGAPGFADTAVAAADQGRSGWEGSATQQAAGGKPALPASTPPSGDAASQLEQLPQQTWHWVGEGEHPAATTAAQAAAQAQGASPVSSIQPLPAAHVAHAAAHVAHTPPATAQHGLPLGFASSAPPTGSAPADKVITDSLSLLGDSTPPAGSVPDDKVITDILSSATQQQLPVGLNLASAPEAPSHVDERCVDAPAPLQQAHGVAGSAAQGAAAQHLVRRKVSPPLEAAARPVPVL